jgi:hypothetical protein
VTPVIRPDLIVVIVELLKLVELFTVALKRFALVKLQLVKVDPDKFVPDKSSKDMSSEEYAVLGPTITNSMMLFMVTAL